MKYNSPSRISPKEATQKSVWSGIDKIANLYSFNVVQKLLHPAQKRPQLALVGPRAFLLLFSFLLLDLQLPQTHPRVCWYRALKSLRDIPFITYSLIYGPTGNIPAFP